jgi:glycosyltransferase involved in cell wall biosynthesis
MALLSIITINYNDYPGLKRTMESVFSQTFKQFEYIVIDGGSTDESKDIIMQHQDQLYYWVSEKDNGIFNAMNKGIKQAKGDYLLFLNSGDHLYDDTVLSKVFDKEFKEDIIYGNVVWEPATPHSDGVFPDALTFEYFVTYSLPHQASFIRRSLFETVGLYDENYKIIPDWLFFVLAIYKFNCSYKHINELISVCNTEGLSFSTGIWDTIVAERAQATNEHFAAFKKELETFYALRNELSLVKRTKGYRLHIKLKNLLLKYFKSNS